jgi:type IV secretory pathway VirB6-like protein
MTDVITIIHDVLWANLGAFRIAGTAIVGFLLALELMEEAFDLATGRGFKLDKRLLTYMFCAVFIVGYPILADAIWSSALGLGSKALDGFIQIKEQILTQTEAAMNAMNAACSGFFGILSAIKALPSLICFGIGVLFMIIALIVIYIMLAGAFASLAFVIVLGPFFIPFILNPATRGMFISWVSNVISYLIMIPMLGWAISITVSIFFDAATKTMLSFSGKPGFSHLLTLLLGPLTCIGIAMNVPKVVSSLIGGGGGAGGAMMGAAAAGAGMAIHGGSVGGGASGGTHKITSSSPGGQNITASKV